MKGISCAQSLSEASGLKYPGVQTSGSTMPLLLKPREQDPLVRHLSQAGHQWLRRHIQAKATFVKSTDIFLQAKIGEAVQSK